MKYTFTTSPSRQDQCGGYYIRIPVDVWEGHSRNGYATITIEPPKRPRTTGKDSQNHHFRGHCADIAHQAGCTAEMAAYAVKIWAVEHLGYPSEVFMGKLLPQSEAAASVEDCAKLIEAAHQFAYEYNYELRERQ